MPKFQKVRQNPPRLAKFQGLGSCFCCNNHDKPKFVRVLTGHRKGGKKAGKDRSPTGGRNGPSHPAVEVSPQLSPQTQETQPNGPGSERCHQHSTHGCRSTHEELGSTPQSSSNSRSPMDSPNSRSSPELPSSRNSQASPTSMNSQNSSSSQNVPPGIGYRNQLRERVRNGGRSFLRVSGSFPLYSHRMMRNIHTR